VVARCGGAKHISKSKHTKIYVRSTFGSWDAEVEKSARGCGAKHISKSKCAKHTLLSEHFWKFTRHCGAKQMSKSTCQKTPQVRNAFGDWDVEKVRTIVARSTLPAKHVAKSKRKKHPVLEAFLEVETLKTGSKSRSQNANRTKCLDHWKKGCDAGKSSRRCKGKQNSKWKWQKHHMLGLLLEVERSTKCTHVHAVVVPPLDDEMSVLHCPTPRFTTLHYHCNNNCNNYNYTTTTAATTTTTTAATATIYIILC